MLRTPLMQQGFTIQASGLRRKNTQLINTSVQYAYYILSYFLSIV